MAEYSEEWVLSIKIKGYSPDGNPNKEKSTKSEMFHAMGMISQLGISMAICVFLGIIIGTGLDKLFNSAPGFLILFAFVGAGAAFKVMFDLTMKGGNKK